MKKIFSLLLITVLILGTAQSALGAELQKPVLKEITNETVITTENIYDVVKYVGLKESDVVYNANNYFEGDVTVGDLLNAIKESKNFPSVITEYIGFTDEEIYNSNEVIHSNNEIKGITKTVSRTTTLGSLTLYYTATGEYATDSNGQKYWIKHVYSTVDPRSTGVGTYYQVERINRWIGYIDGIPTYNTALVVEADYVVGYYVGVKGIGIKLSEVPVQAAHRYPSSSYL